MINLKVFGNHDDGTLNQIKNCVEKGGLQGVLCADGHKGYAQPIGGVVAYDNAVSVSGVGFDIGCGNMAVRTDIRQEVLTSEEIPAFVSRISHRISFGVGRYRDEELPDEYAAFFEKPEWRLSLIGDMKQKARQQLGTVGSGNHYVDLFFDDDRFLWIGVHFGSRGFGHQTATRVLKAANAKDGIDVDPCVLSLDSELGADYWAAMHLAGEYAMLGRSYVMEKVLEILGCSASSMTVHNHHNFAWKENGKIVVRKGSTPNFPGQQSFVGGSMGDDAVIIEGIESDTNRDALYSTVHGAGRVMSRTQAAGRFKKETDPVTGKVRKIRQPGLCRHDKMIEWVNNKGVYLIGGGTDESPEAYRRLTDVLEFHKETFKILYVLHPVGVVMAGDQVHDPYKD